MATPRETRASTRLSTAQVAERTRTVVRSNQLSDADDSPFGSKPRKRREVIHRSNPARLPFRQVAEKIVKSRSYVSSTFAGASTLAYDVLFIIMSYLGPKNITQAAQVCKAWYEVALSSFFVRSSDRRRSRMERVTNALRTEHCKAHSA